jgi:hypothetical protein
MYTNEFDAFKAVKRDPMNLKEVTYQTLSVCRRATRVLPLSFIYITDPDIRRVLANELSTKEIEI